MKVYYCPKRGSLEEALKERRSFGLIEHALAYCCFYDFRANDCVMFGTDDIYVSYNSYDERIQQEIFLVCVGKYGKTNFLKEYGRPQAIGYLHFPPTSTEKISEWKSVYKEKCLPAKEFIKFFEGKEI